MIKEQITKDIVGLTFNGVLVTKVTDGTMDTVPEVIYRYKFRGKTGFMRDSEERVIIKESPIPLYGDRINGRQVGTVLIDVRCANPDDKRVWWVKDPVFQAVLLDRDPVTRRPIMNQKLVKPVHEVGTYDEFLAVVNSRDKTGEFVEPPKDEREAQPFTDEETDFIKENYLSMTDAQLAENLQAEEKLVRDYRLNVLGLKKPKGGVRG